MTVKELHTVMAMLIANGHGGKEIGFPEGIHSSQFIQAKVEENKDSDDHPGFVWIEVK